MVRPSKSMVPTFLSIWFLVLSQLIGRNRAGHNDFKLAGLFRGAEEQLVQR